MMIDTTAVFDWILKYSGIIAWTPFFIDQYNKRKAKPIYVIFDDSVTVGFNTSGSFILIRLGMYGPSKSDDTVFERYFADIKRSDNAKFELQSGHIQNAITTKLVTETNTSVMQQSIRQDIMTVVQSGYIVDKDVTFYETKVKKELKQAWEKVTEKESFVTSNGQSRDNLINSQEISSLVTKINGLMIWQPGEYEFTLNIKSQSGEVTLKNNKFSFVLTSEDCSTLERNKSIVGDWIKSFLKQPRETLPVFSSVIKDITRLAR